MTAKIEGDAADDHATMVTMTTTKKPVAAKGGVRTKMMEETGGAIPRREPRRDGRRRQAGDRSARTPALRHSAAGHSGFAPPCSHASVISIPLMSSCANP